MMSNYQVNTNDPLPRYYQVYVSLEERIRSGEFAPWTALPSERQLSQDYGVSRITIVKALDFLVRDNLIERQHGRGNYVTSQEEVLECMEDCKIAFCVPTPSESYIFSTLMGATRVAMRKRIQLQVVEVGSGEEEATYVRNLLASGITGLILFSRSTHLNAPLYQELQQKDFPFVMIDRFSSEVATDFVVFDDEEAAYQLTDILIKNGHQRIAFLISTEPHMTCVQGRLHGYRKALEEHNLVYDEGWICRTIYEVFGFSPDDLDCLQDMYVGLLARIHQDGPTAIVAINNYSAEQANIDLMKIQMAFLQAAIDDQPQKVDPELNVAVAAISHKYLALNHTFLVALALQQGEVLGARAMDLLIGRIDGTVSGPPRSVTLPMEIVQIAG